jgi:hypothetical protein
MARLQVAPFPRARVQPDRGNPASQQLKRYYELMVVAQFEILTNISIAFGGVIPSRAVFQAERGISRGATHDAREIPPPAGENAGVRDDASRKKFKLSHY